MTLYFDKKKKATATNWVQNVMLPFSSNKNQVAEKRSTCKPLQLLNKHCLRAKRF